MNLDKTKLIEFEADGEAVMYSSKMNFNKK